MDELTWPPNSPEILNAIEGLFAGGKWWVYKGEVVRAFEQRFAGSHGCQYGVSVCTGMIGLEVALRALGIGPGDRVVLPAHNYYSLPKSVSNTGAEPVFVDILPDNLTVDPAGVHKAVSVGARAVVAVHLSGCVAKLDELTSICQDAGVPLLEDCAQAHGASYQGRRVGSWGTVGLFSFGGVKLMTCGQGGLITTSDPKLYERCYAVANRGSLPSGGVNPYGIVGDNYELSDLAAVTLGPQLDLLEELCEKREATMRYLDEKIARMPGCQPVRQFEGSTCRPQMRYSFYYRPATGAISRDQVLAAAKDAEIPLAGSYSAITRDPRLFGRYGTNEDFPNAREAEETVLSFMHHHLLRDREYWDDLLARLRVLVQG